MTKKIVLDNKEIFVAVQEYLSKRNIELPENVSVTMGLKKRLPGDLFSDDYIPYIEVEYNG
jgi:hypothetical protein